jgi:hypothetical protein
MKTYMSILYFNTGLNERINVGLIMFNELYCLVEIKQSKMEFVKLFKPESFELFEYAVTSFKDYYSKEIMPTHAQIKRLSIYNNGVFKLEKPNFIAVEFTGENFNKFFDKHI